MNASKLSVELGVGVSQEQVEEICDYFGLDEDGLELAVEEGDIRAFDDFATFFGWYFNDVKESLLVDKLWEAYHGAEIIDESQVLKLDDGKTIFMY